MWSPVQSESDRQETLGGVGCGRGLIRTRRYSESLARRWLAEPEPGPVTSRGVTLEEVVLGVFPLLAQKSSVRPVEPT